MRQNTIKIDIINEIIMASYTGGKYKGEEVAVELNKTLQSTNSIDLLILDIRNADPLDYLFCKYAFGPLVQKIQGNSHPILFILDAKHKKCFFRGLLRWLGKELPKNSTAKDYQEIFEKNNMNIMIMCENNNINFIGEMNTIETTLLELINEKDHLSERDIVDIKKEYQPTIIIESLKSLSQKGFIVSHTSDENMYTSIYKLLS